MKFTTKNDVEPQLNGFSEWEFSGKASFSGFCDYVWKNWDNETYNEYHEYDKHGNISINNCISDEFKNEIMKNYLISVHENPSDYSI